MRFLAVLVTLASLAPWLSTRAQDAVVGEVLGKPVHASEIRAATEQERASSLRAVLVSPAIGAYLKAHEAETSLTEAESEAIIDSYNAYRQCAPESGLAELKPPFDRFLAQMIGGNTKAQRFIYLNHGRGRVLFQQAGMEAFDATYRLILQLEKDGDIRFASPEDRALALSYWTTQEHSSFLLPDPGIDEAFRLEGLMRECP